jgi:hypothetical protein
MAYDPRFTGGAYVAADAGTGGRADIITGVGPGGGPHMEVFDAVTHDRLDSFFAYAPAFTGGAEVAAVAAAGGGFELVTGAGPGGGPYLCHLSNPGSADVESFFAFAPGFTGGIFVAG